ncbi:hypothetical protein FACS1894133_2270 [Clostridia bacterium]|nr:hypothetical protein FACS1894133_2270 [Clostridia bacterium]
MSIYFIHILLLAIASLFFVFMIIVVINREKWHNLPQMLRIAICQGEVWITNKLLQKTYCI